ncbi:hypothetical protein ACSVDA_12020 [Cytobacillus sp. Hm23]
MDSNKYNVQLASYLKQKYQQGAVEGHELVVTLVAMAEDNKIKYPEIKPILYKIFHGNIEGMFRSLTRAKAIIDKELIHEIVEEVRDSCIEK